MWGWLFEGLLQWFDIDISGILTPDKFQFWAEMSISPALILVGITGTFTALSKALPANCNSLQISIPLHSEAQGLIKLTRDSCSLDLRKQMEHQPGYPEAWMRHLLEVMSGNHKYKYVNYLHRLAVTFIRSSRTAGSSCTCTLVARWRVQKG
jgi:hypothetical protein